MSDPWKPSQVLVTSAIASGVLYLAGLVALGTPPNVDSNGVEVVAWFTAHGSAVRFYAWTAAAIALGLSIALGIVSTLLPRPHRYIFLVGAAGWIIEMAVQAWFWAGLALHPQGLDPSAARTIFDISLFWGPLVNGATTAMAAAIAALGFGRTPRIPPWLKWLSVAFLAEQALETVTVFGLSGFLAPGGTMNVAVGGIFGFAWGAGLILWAVRVLKHTTPARED